MVQSRRFWLLSTLVLLFVFLGSYTLLAWTPLAVDEDPLVRMPGTQPGEVTTLEGPNRCFNCHAGFDEAVEPGFNWMGSMMAQSARDFLFWACFTVAGQDSIWALDNPNAGDICERCHFPQGWLEGRSDPPNASAMTGVDYDGVQCDFCHNMYNPFFEETHNWAREGDLDGDGTVDESEWEAYWDETNDSETPSATAAATTYAEDAFLAETVTFFNGEPFYGTDNFPVYSGYTENASGQYFVSPDGDKRASFTDAMGRHDMLYSRYHKSRDYCSTCHDVSNPALANLGQTGTDPLTTEMQSAYSYYHVERTFSEFMLSDYGQDGGSPGIGPYTPNLFMTSHTGNAIATCQDCHMPDTVGKASSMSDAVVRPTGSVEHPQSGQPVHDLTGGNMWVGYVLASAVPKGPNHDPVNEALLDQGPDALTLDLGEGDGFDPDAILAGVDRAYQQLLQAAAIEELAYDPASGAITFRVQNQTGHKLISGFPEGRRMFIGVKIYASGELVYEVNPYDATIGTLKGLPAEYSHSSPDLAPGESYVDELVYELHPSSTLTGESSSFHFALADGRYKDNRIPPKGFRIADASGRLSEPVWHGESAPGYFTEEEYAGGYDAVDLSDYGLSILGADRVEVGLYYQTTSREYVEFLRDEINGDQNQTLPSTGYVIQTDPFFEQLRAWGDTIWQLWEHNKDLPGAAPVLMTDASVDVSVATVSFSSPTYAVSELGASATITVTRSGALAHTASVQYATGDGTAGPADYTPVSGSLSFVPGVITQTFSIPILNDDLFEGDETVLLSLSDSVDAVIGIGEADLTIVDDEAEPTLSIADASAGESDGDMVFHVMLSHASTLDVSVDWATSDGPAGPGGATAGSDYTGGSGTLDILAGSTQEEIHVPILSDSWYEGDEVFTVQLRNPVNAGVSDASGQGTIDDDESPPVIAFGEAEYMVDEDVTGGAAVIAVTLTGDTALAASVQYSTSDGSASSADYTPVSGSLSFLPGVTEQTFSISITDDDLIESDETVLLSLSDPVDATIGTGEAVLTIVDDEGEPTLSISDASAWESEGTMVFYVTLSSASTLGVSVDWATSDGPTGPGGAVAGEDYTGDSGTLEIDPGLTEGQITITILPDDTYEGNEVFSVELGNPVNATVTDALGEGTIVDDEAEPTLSIADASAGENEGTMVFDVTLSPASALGVSVDWATGDGPEGPGGASAGSDYTGGSGTLDIDPGSTQGEIHVPILQDPVYEGSEVFTVELSNPMNAGLVDALGEGTIIDDESPPVVSFAQDSYTVDENDPGGSAAITVTLTGDTVLTATVTYEASDGTAGLDDYTAVSGTLVFTPGVTSRIFAVPITDDDLDELDESVLLALSEPVSATLGTSSAQLIIVDDEGEPTLSISDASAGENDGTMVFYVTLSFASEIDVSVDWATSDGPTGPGGAVAGADYTGDSGTLDFLAGSTKGEIHVPILQDSFYEGSEVFAVELSSPTHASVSDALGEGTILDDESPPVVSFDWEDYSVDEDTAEGAATITVSLAGDTVLTATVSYGTSDGTAGPADYAAVSGTLVFTPGVTTRTFAVPITNDARDEPDETVLLALSEPVSATLGTSSAQLTIADDDLPPEITIGDVALEEADGTMQFPVNLSAPSGRDIQLVYATSNGIDPSSATAGVDYSATSGILNIPAGASSAFISVDIFHDQVYELDEIFQVTLSSPVNATLLDAEATGTILNNDAAPEIEFETDLYDVGEEDGTVTLTVTLSGPTALAAAVNYATSDGPLPAGARAGEDYVQASGTITFLPDETSHTIILTILGDTEPEVTETFVVTLSEPTYSSVGSTSSATVEIVDDDAYRVYLPLVVRAASP